MFPHYLSTCRTVDSNKKAILKCKINYTKMLTVINKYLEVVPDNDAAQNFLRSCEKAEEWKSNLIKVERFKPSTTNYTGWSKPITRSNPYYGHSDFYQSQKTQFNSTNQFPVEYTDLEKKDEVIKVMKEWMYNYGDSMDIKDYSTCGNFILYFSNNVIFFRYF